jgi:hypothetical protein
MAVAGPKCPSCGTVGIDHIVSEESAQQAEGGDPWFEVAFCDTCGHIYGVFAKVVLWRSTTTPALRFEPPNVPR